MEIAPKDGKSRQCATDKRERMKRGYPKDVPRILVVDDHTGIHGVFRNILAPRDNDLADFEDELGFAEPAKSHCTTYSVDFATQGEEGLSLVQQALASDQPYRVAFVDVRMPPGIDGIKTAALMREKDPCLQIVICTAYSDYAWPEMVERLGDSESFLILKKPFDITEVRQLACSLSIKWELHRERQQRLRELEEAVSARTSSLREANEKLQREMDRRVHAERELMQSQRLRALGRLVAGVGHEINNPLSYVTANVGFVRDSLTLAEIENSDELLRALNDALYGASRIEAIVKEVRQFAGGNRATCIPVDVRHVIKASLAMIEHQISHRGKLVQDLGPVPMIDGDPQQLGQIVTNLLTNASQALIETDISVNEVRVASFEGADGTAVIEVEDNGAGIARAEMDRVFDPFFTTREVGQGMGLGLSISHEIVTRLGGKIAINSTAGQGTRVTVTLPPGKERPAMAPRKPKSAPKDTRVLLVDDDGLVLSVMQRMLKGWRVDAAASAKEALQLCATQTYDVVICDLMMPEMSGMELYEKLAEHGYADKMFFLTGGAFTTRAEEFLADKAVVCLHKPVTRDQLLQSIADMLDGPHVGPIVAGS